MKSNVKVPRSPLPYLLAAAFTVQTLVALAPYYWVFELFTHYAHYYALIALLFTTLHLYRKEWIWTLGWLTLFIVNVLPLAPYLFTSAPLNHPSLTSYQTPELTLLAQNVYYETSDTSEFYDRVNSIKPELFIVHEANSTWGTAPVPSDYPYHSLTKKTGAHGIFMGSQNPGTFTEIPLGSQVGLEFIPEDQSYRVLGVHPTAPLASAWAADRNAQFEDLLSYVQSSELPTVIIGDFNATPWSPYLKALIEDSGLHDARLGFGLKTTWKANSPLFWLPIDHALVSPDFSVLDFNTYPTEDSDHKAIEVELHF